MGPGARLAEAEERGDREAAAVRASAWPIAAGSRPRSEREAMAHADLIEERPIARSPE
jgi:hypothetical protein